MVALFMKQIHIANYINNFVKILTLRESYIKYYLKFLIYENFIVYNKNVAFLDNQKVTSCKHSHVDIKNDPESHQTHTFSRKPLLRKEETSSNLLFLSGCHRGHQLGSELVAVVFESKSRRS